jgi:hypothetical protein
VRFVIKASLGQSRALRQKLAPINHEEHEEIASIIGFP